jgi:hypothetical protein
MHRRVLCLANVVLCLRIINGVLRVYVKGWWVHFLMDHVDVVLSSFDLRQLQWYQSATSPKETCLRHLRLKFTLMSTDSESHKARNQFETYLLSRVQVCHTIMIDSRDIVT